MPWIMGGYDSGWYIIGKLVGIPILFSLTMWLLVKFVVWCLVRGAAYRQGAEDFIGVGPMIGLNLLLPGSGMLAGGFFAQGWAFLVLWAMVFLIGVRYANLLARNLTVIHLFAGVWASALASVEVSTQAKRVVAEKRKKLTRITLQKERVPTMEDPDFYMVRLEVFQLLLEASADPLGGFQTVQKAAINRIRNLLKIDERTYSRLLKQLKVHGEAQKTLGDGALLGAVKAFEKILPTAIDHPAFEGCRNPFLDSLANLLGIPSKEAKGRRAAYENGETYLDEDSSVTDLGDDETQIDGFDDDLTEADATEFSGDDPTIL
jgi:hypothetical protein